MGPSFERTVEQIPHDTPSTGAFTPARPPSPPLLRANKLFEAAGFEKRVVRRLILPERRYVEGEEATLAGRRGLSRALLSPRFRGMPEVDLRTAAAHYL